MSSEESKCVLTFTTNLRKHQLPTVRITFLKKMLRWFTLCTLWTHFTHSSVVLYFSCSFARRGTAVGGSTLPMCNHNSKMYWSTTRRMPHGLALCSQLLMSISLLSFFQVDWLRQWRTRELPSLDLTAPECTNSTSLSSQPLSSCLPSSHCIRWWKPRLRRRMIPYQRNLFWRHQLSEPKCMMI